MSSEATTFPAGGATVADERRQPPPPRNRMQPAQSESLETRLIATVGTAALLLMIVGAFALVAIGAGHPAYVSPFSHDLAPGWLSGPLAPVGRTVHLGLHSVRFSETVGIGGAFFCWLILLACGSRMTTRVAVAGVVALHVIFFLSPPLSLTDVFNYINYGRMGVVHGLNPYTQIPVLEPHTDPTYLLSNWHHLLSPYGPLFTLFTYALVPLGVAASFWVLKVVLLAAALGTLRLVWLSAELLGVRPLVPTLFVGANPVVLLWGLGGDHNDFLMMFFLILAVYLLLRARAAQLQVQRPPAQPTAVLPGVGLRRLGATGTDAFAAVAPAPASAALQRLVRSPELWAGVSLMAAVAIKASVAVILPVVLFAAPRPRRLVIGLVAGAAVFGAASLIAFGAHIPDLSTQSSLVTPESPPNLLGLALGQGGETDALRRILDLLLVATVAGATVWAWRTRRWLPAAGVAIFALLLTLSWELPWYVYWLLPLAALSRGRWLRVAGIVLSAYLILAWMPLLGDFLNAINFRPASTQLAKQHQAATKALLRGN